jgi:hypothetical protein
MGFLLHKNIAIGDAPLRYSVPWLMMCPGYG